jgi:CIC family chloride channel protein
VPQPGIFAVVAMAAYFTAVVRAPLTGIVLILEMTGNYGQMLPLIVACFAAYAVAEAMNDRPIYEALLERDLARGGVSTQAEEPSVLEFIVQPGAPFDGKRVRELGLPPGCILVSCRDDAREWVPNANTRIKAEDRITAVVAPEAAGAISLLRHGTEAPTVTTPPRTGRGR